MASWSSHRQMVDPEIVAAIPRRITSSRMSGTNRRDNGSSRVLGSSHAIALTAITTSGGKIPGSSLPGGVLEAAQAFIEEALSPFAHDLARQVQPACDLLVREPLGRVQDDLRPHDISIRSEERRVGKE